MYQKKTKDEIRCPLEYGLKVFGGKWKARIICVLAELGILRYGEIKKQMMDITDAVLSSNLKELMMDEIILRKQYNEIPPRVEYSLTSKGKSVLPILKSICAWSGAFRKGDMDDLDVNLLKQCQKCDYKAITH